MRSPDVHRRDRTTVLPARPIREHRGAEYKAKFTAHKEAYTHAENVELPERDVAMDFLYGLDNARYAGFKADIENDRAKGVASPQSLNDMYHRASCFVVVKGNWQPSGGAAFVTHADEYQQQEDSRHEDDNGGRSVVAGAVTVVAVALVVAETVAVVAATAVKEQGVAIVVATPRLCQGSPRSH